MIKGNTPSPVDLRPRYGKAGAIPPSAAPSLPAVNWPANTASPLGNPAALSSFCQILKGFNPLRPVLAPVLNSLSISPKKKNQNKEEAKRFLLQTAETLRSHLSGSNNLLHWCST